MKIMIRFLQIGICLLIFCCPQTNASKDEFLWSYNALMYQVRVEYKQYKIDDWLRVHGKYNQFVFVEYPKFKFTTKEDSLIKHQSREFWHLELIYLDEFVKSLDKFIKSLSPNKKKTVVINVNIDIIREPIVS
jgi:ABC-type lipoprotein release transport system permease subunit